MSAKDRENSAPLGTTLLVESPPWRILSRLAPLLDHKVMESCASLPSAYKLRGLTLKYLLKQAGGRLLPPRPSVGERWGLASRSVTGCGVSFGRGWKTCCSLQRR